MTRRAFTVVELLVVVSIIALLMGILLPAVGKARDQALLTRSVANLTEIGAAHGIYAAEWNDRQVTFINDSISAWGPTRDKAFAHYKDEIGSDHLGMILGWSSDMTHWSFAANPAAVPIEFEGDSRGWGAFRVPNAWALNQYLNGRLYDEIWFAPKDKAVISAVEPCFEDAGDFCFPQQQEQTVLDPSYSLSAAAMFHPSVFGFGNSSTTWVNPWSRPSAFRSPTVSQAMFPELKTRTIEHHWLNGDVRQDCNGNFLSGQYDGCQPYYFNHSWHSVPQCLMYDGHVEGVGVRQAREANERAETQAGRPLWSDDCPSFRNYFHEQAYDFGDRISSFHVLTVDGIKGRDFDAR